MDTEILFYKEHTVFVKDVEIIFHKEYTYLFNKTDSFPVIKFTLINCKDLSDIQFENIDYYNDGVTVDINKEIEQTTFRASDMGGGEFKISCDKVFREDLKYRHSDLIDIIKSTKKESDDNDARAAMFNNRIESLTVTLKHDLDIIQRKLEQASWLNKDKKQFLEGQKSSINHVLEFIDKKQRTVVPKLTEF